MRARNTFNKAMALLLIAACGAIAAFAQPRPPSEPVDEAVPQARVAAPDSRLRPGQAIAKAELENFVDGVVNEAMAESHIAGLSVAVVQNGGISLLKGYGAASLEPKAMPVDPHRTAFTIASTSKPFTWILMMKEVSRGRIRLDAPVNDYLPADMKIPDDGFVRPVQIRDLFAHSAGFEDRDLASHPATNKSASVVSLRDHLANEMPRRVRAPGQFSTYSNYGVALAGFIVARLNGTDYQTLVEREILRPLKLGNTSFRLPYSDRPDLPAPLSPTLTANLSKAFTWDGTEFRQLPYFVFPEAIGPSGSATTTAADMARYMMMQLRGGTLDGVAIYDAKAAQAFRTPVLKTPAGVSGWAHGFIVYNLPGGFTGYGHAGAGEAAYTSMIVIPALDLGIFITANTDTAGRSCFASPISSSVNSMPGLRRAARGRAIRLFCRTLPDMKAIMPPPAALIPGRLCFWP